MTMVREGKVLVVDFTKAHIAPQIIKPNKSPPQMGKKSDVYRKYLGTPGGASFGRGSKIYPSLGKSRFSETKDYKIGRFPGGFAF